MPPSSGPKMETLCFPKILAQNQHGAQRNYTEDIHVYSHSYRNLSSYIKIFVLPVHGLKCYYKLILCPRKHLSISIVLKQRQNIRWADSRNFH